MVNGWNTSAAAWIADMGERGDFARVHVLDGPMMARVRAVRPATALDVGCGEGRFCRMMAAEGIAATGIDPTTTLVTEARQRDPAGLYIEARAERLPFPTGTAEAGFDLVVSYLSLIDIEDFEVALDEMMRVLAPGGHLLIANMASHATALPDGFETSGWVHDADGRRVYHASDNYLDRRASWVRWRGIEVRNHHRPLRDYMAPCLAAGMQLCEFDEPAPVGVAGETAEAMRRMPLFVLMDWRKPRRGV